jgi:hypothetical protein
MPLLAHIGVGLASKYIAPKINVFALICAAMVPDIVAIVFSLPIFPPGTYTVWTHSVFMGIVWAIIAGLITFIVSRDRRTSIIIGVLALSHEIMDIIGWPLTGFLSSMTQSIPIFFDLNQTIGLGLYSTVLGAYVTDLVVFVFGLIVYLYTKQKAKKTNK